MCKIGLSSLLVKQNGGFDSVELKSLALTNNRYKLASLAVSFRKVDNFERKNFCKVIDDFSNNTAFKQAFCNSYILLDPIATLWTLKLSINER